MSELRPAVGQLIETEGDLPFSTIAKLIDFDFDDELDESDPITGYSAPSILIGGDLLIDGDISSRTLPFGRKGFTRDSVFTTHNATPHTLVVLGNLTVRGNLEVAQYFDLFVAGNVDVHSYRSHSANFVCSGTLTARDLICTEANEEGGIVFPKGGAVAPAWVVAGRYYEDEVELQGEEIAAEEFDGEDWERTRHALSVALEKPLIDGDDVWEAVAQSIEGGKVARFLEAYRGQDKAQSLE